MSDYQKTEICEPIIAANRNHCYVPAEVWDVDAATVCGVCQAKNAGLISALMQKIPVATPQPVAVSIKAPVVSIKAAGMPPAPFCQTCGIVKIWERRWNDGERECSACKPLNKSNKLICRFCCREVSVHAFRIKDQMCTRAECWEMFNAEWKQRKSAAS